VKSSFQYQHRLRSAAPSGLGFDSCTLWHSMCHTREIVKLHQFPHGLQYLLHRQVFHA
jgi:hypothetical protein